MTKTYCGHSEQDCIAPNCYCEENAIKEAAQKARWALTAMVELHGPDPAGMAMEALNDLDRALSSALETEARK